MTNPMPYAHHSAIDAEQSQRVLRNTYGLLAMSLAISAGAAWFAMAANVGFINPFIVLGVYFALLFANAKLEDSAWGVLTVFGITGWLGFTTGPIINAYTALGAGNAVTLALGMTATIFVAMSAIGMMVKRDLSGLGRFKIGRASCRERVELAVCGGPVRKKQKGYGHWGGNTSDN